MNITKGIITKVSGNHVFIRSGETDYYASRSELSDEVNRTAHFGMAVTFSIHQYVGDGDCRDWAANVQKAAA